MLVGLVLGGRPSRAAGAKGRDVLHRAGIGAAAHHEQLAPLHRELSRVDREQAAHGVDAGDGGAFVVLHAAAVELSVRERPGKGRAAPPLTRGDGIEVGEDADQLLPSPISA